MLQARPVHVLNTVATCHCDNTNQRFSCSARDVEFLIVQRPCLERPTDQTVLSGNGEKDVFGLCRDTVTELTG